MKKLYLLPFILLLISFICFQEEEVRGQAFDVFISNDSATNSTTYEFDVFIRSMDSSTWAFRTIQFGFYVNPAWLPAGASPSISFIPGTSTLANYVPGSVQMNASPNSLSAFTIATNLAGLCGSGTQFTSFGQTERVGRFRIESNSGPMNCTPCNISMIRPIPQDTLPGANVLIKMAVSKWSDPNCTPGTSTLISANGTYSSIIGSTLLNDFRNMAPVVSAPSDTTAFDCGIATFTVQANGIAGQTAPLQYQWFENGAPLTDNNIYSGTNSPTLTISNPPLSLNGNFYYAGVSQCVGNSSIPAMLTVSACTGTTELQNVQNVSVFPNPSNGKIFIGIESSEKPTACEVINILNQKVYSTNPLLFHGSRSEEMDLNISAGVYVLKVIFAHGISEKKFIVN